MAAIDLNQVAWRTKLKGSDGPWALIDETEYARIKNHQHLVFDPLYSLADNLGYKLSGDRAAIVSLTNQFMPIGQDTPLGVKVQCLNEGNVAIYATVTTTTRHLYKGWYPVPKIPPSMR